MANTTSSIPSSPEFKVGDKVVCIEPNWYLTKGRVYTVIRINEDLLNEISIDNTGMVWAHSRFRLAPPFYPDRFYPVNRLYRRG